MTENPKQAAGDRKPAFDCVPSSALLELAVKMQEGARKYGPFNWRETGVRFRTYIGAVHRHLAALADGEWTDPESPIGGTHLGAIMACAAILIDCHELGNLIDDRGAAVNTGERIRFFQEHGRLPARSDAVADLQNRYIDVAAG